MQELEILHARWAMLAAVGCVVPELLPEGVVPEPLWYKVGKAKLEGVSLDYLGIEGFRIAGKQGIAVIALCQLALMGGPEYARYVGIASLEPVGIYLPGDANYPGGTLFDPLNLADDPVASEKLKVSEMKHGRLAMLAMLAYAVEAAVSDKGPVGALQEFISSHLSAPLDNNNAL